METTADVAIHTVGNLVVLVQRQSGLFMVERRDFPIGMAMSAHFGATGGLVADGAVHVHFVEASGMQ